MISYNIEGLIILSHTIPSEELASYNIPIVAIEREDQHICSVNTDKYMGAVQETSLLVKNGCDIVIHVNSHLTPEIPSYGRIQGFTDFCTKYDINHKLILTKVGSSFEENYAGITKLF